MVTDPIILMFFIGAAALLVITPGPIVSLLIAETLSQGAKVAIFALMGVETAAIIQLIIYNLGFIWLIESSPQYIFDFIRYGGAAFLLYLAYQRFTQPFSTLTTPENIANTRKKAYLSGFFITLTNPKAIVFFAVFFPQFIDPSNNIAAQLIELSIAFFLTSMCLDLVWIGAASKARLWFSERGRTAHINKIAGFVLLSAALFMIIVY